MDQLGEYAVLQGRVAQEESDIIVIQRTQRGYMMVAQYHTHMDLPALGYSSIPEYFAAELPMAPPELFNCLDLGRFVSRENSSQPTIPTSFPGTVQMKGYLTTQDGRLFEYEILIPQSWIGNDKFEYRKDGNINYFDYNASPKHTLFVIAAFTEAQWQEVRHELKYSEELILKDGIFIVYNVALDNPYTGNQAEEFQQMAGEVKNIVQSLTISMVSTSAEMEEARKVLMTYFDLMSEGNYAEAAKLYGGTYENLTDMNPDIDPSNRVALLERACTVNGFKCLPIMNIVQEVQDWPDTFIFTVEFANLDSSLFVFNACCGTTETNTQPQSQFDYTVLRIPQMGDIFLVRELPLYVP